VRSRRRRSARLGGGGDVVGRYVVARKDIDVVDI